MLSRLRSCGTFVSNGIGNCCGVVGNAMRSCCARTLSIARDYIVPPLKFLLVTDIALETFAGLGARAYFNTVNNMNYLASTENDQDSSHIVAPAIMMGVMAFTFASLTRSKPTIALFYSEKKEEKAELEDKQVAQITPCTKVRRVCGKAVEYMSDASCLITMSLTMCLTYASFATIYEKFIKSDPTVSDTDWRQVLFCLKMTSSALPPYIGWNIIPAFKNAKNFGEFVATGKITDINWSILVATLGLTSFNLVGAFYIGSFGFESSVPKIIGLRDLLSIKPSTEVCNFAASINVTSSIVMMLPSAYNYIKGVEPTEIPKASSPFLKQVTCNQVENPWRALQAVVYFTGGMDIVVGGFSNSLTSTGKTLARLTPYQSHAPGIIILGSLSGMGAIVMGFPFAVRGGFKRMLPPKKQRVELKTEVRTMLEEPLLSPTDVNHQIDMKAIASTVTGEYVPPPPTAPLDIPKAKMPGIPGHFEIRIIPAHQSVDNEFKDRTPSEGVPFSYTEGVLSRQSFIVKKSKAAQSTALLGTPSRYDFSLSMSL